MANNRPPKNDFAPAWLRLPETNPSPAVANSKIACVRERKLDAHSSYGFTGHGYQPHSFFDHSENGESRLAYSLGHGTDYNIDSFSGSPYKSSQVGSYRGSKVTGSRTDQVNGIANGGGYDYYDEVDDLHAGEHYRGQSWVGSGLPPQGSQVGVVRRPKQQYAGDKDVIASRTNGRRQETRLRRLGDSRDDDVDDNMVEMRVKDEFPSLIGDSETGDQSGKAVAGAWEKPHGLIRMPPQGPQQTSQPPNSAPASPAGGWSVNDGGSGKKDLSGNQACPSMYKVLVPISGKAVLMRKPSRDAIKTTPVKEAGSSSISQPVVKSPPSSRLRPAASETSSNSSSVASTPPTPIILNVTQPKKLGDKKSHFLRQFKLESEDGGVGDPSSRPDKKQHESKSSTENPADTNDDSVTSCISNMDLLQVAEPDEKILSSSLEAEHRLLREMGWDEGAAEVVEITEEERREFEKQLQQKRQLNGVKATSPSWKMSNGLHAESAAGSSRLHDDSEEDDDEDSDLDVIY